MSLSRDAPCQTSTSMPSECASISFLHCMMATVGLRRDVSTASQKREGGNIRHNKVRFGTLIGDKERNHLDGLAHSEAGSCQLCFAMRVP